MRLLWLLFYQGILVGKVINNMHHIDDCYPLFHSRIMAPTLEVAMNIVEKSLSKDQ